VSPSSIKSEFCNDELAQAVAYNKRLVPILRRQIPENSLPEALSPFNWIELTETDDFETGLQSLVLALDLDIDYLRTHNRILGRALEWKTQAKNSSYLLRGGDLRDAETWLAVASARSDQRPTTDHVDFIIASRRVGSALSSGQRE
jgi:TIR domain-containing protein